MTSLVAIDTNILLRAADQKNMEHTVAKTALAYLRDQKIPIALAPQVLFEYYVVLTRARAKSGFGYTAEKASLVLEELRQTCTFLADPPNLFERWLTLIKQHQVLGSRAHDVRLTAWMLELGITQLISFNTKDFSPMPIQVIHPNNVADKISKV